MNQTRSPRRRALSLLLALALVLGLLPAPALAAEGETESTPSAPAASAAPAGHWAASYLNQLVEWGFIRADQAQNPDKQLTRADFMSIVNRAYGYHETGETPFEDVSEYDWFYDDVGIAYTARYINGTSPTTASPNDALNRETAATILGRNMMLQESPGELMDFSDARDISNWARGTIKSSMEHYLVNGYDDGTFRPQKAMTWGEIAAMVTRTVGTPLQDEGDYSLGGVFGNVTITSPGVTLRDTVISGDLYVTGGVGLGGVKLENVTVLGRIIASGTGASEGGASILLRNVTADELLVDNLQDNEVSIQADGITEIGKTTVRTSAYIEDNTPDGMGLHMISLEGDSYGEDEEPPEGWEPPRLTLAGRVEEVVNRTPDSTIHAAKGTVAKLTIDETATGSHVDIDRGAVVKNLILDASVDVTGEGDVTHLEVNAPDCTVEMLPDEIVIRPGITAIIAGEEMDSTSADEFLLEPMILSGYPKAQDIAPTSLEAVFATNKKGRIYWAVSAITDGSIGADDLIKPPSYGNKAVRWGTLDSPRGNEETIAQITGLTSNGSYYLSAVLEDAKGQLSPVKVISFTTPDNTVPAFNTGYPRMSKVSRTDSVVVVSPNKDCKLYYALLPQGATAPTENELKTNAVAGALGYGVRDVQKNVEDTFRVNDVILDEQVTYVLYLWLVDADGVNKSAIISLTFTTDDETPPEFIVDPSPDMAVVNATSVTLTFRLNENGTVYWVAVPAGMQYPKADPKTDYDTAPLDSLFAKIQVSSGLGIGTKGKSGRVTATENVDGTITVSGLDPEAYYDFYYVAKDNAGPDRNYSVTVKKITIHTQDNNFPTVKQSFYPVSTVGNPKSTSEIYLDFSEDVIFNGTGSNNKSFLELYEGASKPNADAQAVNRFASALAASLELHKFSLTGDEEKITVNTTANNAFTADMTVDYTKVTVTDNRKKGEGIRVTFPNSALHLENGKQYCFKISQLTDSSDNNIEPDVIYFWDTDTVEDTKRKGHDVPVFLVDFPGITLTGPTYPGDNDGPLARNGKTQNSLPLYYELDASGNPTEKTTTTKTTAPVYAPVDKGFKAAPDTTSSVDKTVAYDLLLQTKKPIQYDLYYRIYNGNAVVKTAEELKAVENSLLSKSNGNPDENGWMYLGNSGAHFAANPFEKWVGKSIGFTFNRNSRNGFPLLVNMKDGLTYEFAVSLTDWNGPDRKTWSGTAELQVYAAAGYTYNLYDLGSDIDKSDDFGTRWTKAVNDGLVKGVLDIGSQKPLDISISITDSRIPVIRDGSPTFVTEKDDITKVAMELFLDREGSIHYIISALDEDEHSLVLTTLKEDGSIITRDQVPKAGTGVMGQPELEKPSSDDVFQGALENIVDKGSFDFSGVKATKQINKALDPNTTYYAYFVLRGKNTDLSPVYMYQFTTKKSPKPQINISNNGDSSANLKTEVDISSDYVYLVATKANIDGTDPFNQPFINYIDKDWKDGYIPEGMSMPSAYENYTVLQALIRDYSYGTASLNNRAENPYYPSMSTPQEGGDWVSGASVFDVYAGAEIREQVDSIIRQASTGDTDSDAAKKWFTSGTGSTTAGQSALQPIRNSTGQTIGSGEYVILVAAQNKRKYPNDPPTNGGKDGFKAQILTLNDDSTPRLISANLDSFVKGATSTQDPNNNSWSPPYNGTIQLVFNTELFRMGQAPDVVIGSSSAAFPATLSNGSVTVTSSRPGTATNTFYLQFTGWNGQATIRSATKEYLSNSSNGGALVDMSVQSVKGSVTETYTEMVDDKPVQKTRTREYLDITVYWGDKGTDDPDLCEEYKLERIWLDTLGGDSTVKVDSITVMDSDGTTVSKPSGSGITLTTDDAAQTLYAVLDPEVGTESVKVTWVARSTDIVEISPQGSNGHRAIFRGLKVGTTEVTATAETTTGIPKNAKVTVTVQGKLDNLRLSSTDANAPVTGGTGGAYTWERKDGKEHTATLSFNVGKFNVDTSELAVTSSDETKVECGAVTMEGNATSGYRATVLLTFMGGKNSDSVTITVSGKTAAYWEGDTSKAITITLKTPPIALTDLKLTPNDPDKAEISALEEKSVTPPSPDPNYTCTWTRKDGNKHEAALTFDTGVELTKDNIDVESDDTTHITVEPKDSAKFKIEGKKVTVPLTYETGSGNKVIIKITLTDGTTTIIKRIEITTAGSDTNVFGNSGITGKK